MRRFALTLAMVVVSVAFSGEQLAKQKGCIACHDVKTKKVGPSYSDIARKYAGRADAVDYLASRIRKGSIGVWGSIPMPPQDMNDVEAKQLAQWIMLAK